MKLGGDVAADDVLDAYPCRLELANLGQALAIVIAVCGEALRRDSMERLDRMK